MVQDRERLAMVAHACNPSYLGGRSKRITNSNPVQTKLARFYHHIKTKGLGE
jgi:hypothetical protein